MSKNKKKYRRHRKKFPWLPAALGGLLLVMAAFFFTSRGGDGGGTPAIKVDQEKIDYGYVQYGVQKTLTLKVTNTGDGTLRFTEQPYIEVVEGC